MIRISILLFIIFINFANSQSFNVAKLPIISTYDALDYDGGIQNWKVRQSPEGLIYVANNYGLMEFDGEHWKTYRVEGGTRSVSLMITHEGRIYLGGQNEIGYFKEGNRGLFEFVSLKPLLPGNKLPLENVWSIVEYKGKILFQNQQNLFEFDPIKQQVDVIDLPGSAGFIHDVFGRVFIVIPEKGLYEWDGVSLVLNPGFNLINHQVSGIIPYMKDQFLIFQTNGQVYVTGNNEISYWDFEFETTLNASQVNDVIRLSDNNIAIGTQNNGIIMCTMEGKIVHHFSKGNGIPDNTVYSLFEDQFGNIWAGLNNGIACIEVASPFSLIDESLGLPGTGYAALKHNDDLYLGTNNGVFKLDKTYTGYDLIPGSEGQVYKIKNLDSRILVGHHRGGLEITNDVAWQFYDKSGVWDYAKTYIPGNYIAGTYQGFISFDEQLSNIKKVEGFQESSRIFSFRKDSTLWMVHGFKGVYKLKFDQKIDRVTITNFYGEDQGFPSNILINQFEVQNELLFPAETGIYQYNETADRFYTSNTFEDLFSTNSHISELTTNTRGDVYFIEDHQLGRLVKDRFGRYSKETTTFNKINDYLSDDLENITVLDPENILIGAKNGFIHFDPTITIMQQDSVKILLRNLQVRHSIDSIINYQNSSLDRKLVFDPEVNSFRFHYASPYFDGHHTLRYQYKLEGFDEKWSAWTEETNKEYTSLPYRTYTFKVRVKTVYGEISTPATCEFVLSPPWYLSNYAYGIYSLLAISFFGFIIFMLDKRYRKEKDRITLEKDFEIKLKEGELENYEKASTEKINQLRNENLKKEIDFKNRELASTTMHIINKNEIMLGVKGKLQGLMKSNAIKNEELKKIIRTIDRNLSEDNSWKHFTKHFNEVHGNFLTKLKDQYPDLTPQETKLAAYLRMNLNTKEIAQLLNISVRGVEVSRYRLRKKLAISRDTNLTSFMMDM